MTQVQKPKVLAVVGPTASGKTSLAIDLAKAFQGEVISADSRQVYRGLDIGTAKVTSDEMQSIPHHLIDIVDIDTIYTGQDFADDATDVISSITKQKKLPIIAGGTFFYLELLRGTMQAAPVPPNHTLRKELETKSTSELHELLTVAAPVRAARIDQHNRRRLIRALEISETLGDVPEPRKGTNTPFDMFIVALEVDKEILRERFRARAETWLQNGFREEVQDILVQGVSRARLAEIGFEYTLMLSHIDGELSKDEFIQRFIEKNWQYAKKQLTWLKRDSSIHWINPHAMIEVTALTTAINVWLSTTNEDSVQT